MHVLTLILIMSDVQNHLSQGRILLHLTPWMFPNLAATCSHKLTAGAMWSALVCLRCIILA